MTYVSKIGDFVWEDLNGNGIQDVGEPGIAGVTVYLLDSYGNIVRTTTTNTSGFYSFTNVRFGTYRFQFVAPTGYAFTLKDRGSNDAKDSDVDPLTGKTGTYTFNSTTQNLTIDAGLYRKDITAPTVSSVTYGTNDGALALGETVTLTVNFSEAVTVAGGTPTLALNTGGIATYTSGSGTNALTFTYTPAAGQNTADLATAATALVLPAGTTIKDAAGNNAVLSGANNVNPSGILAVDTTAPTVSSMTYGTNDGALALGETVTLTVNFSEAVTVAGGTPTLALNTGGIATYTSGSGTNALTFTYTPAAGQNTADLATAATALVLPAGTIIKDAAGNNTVLSGANSVNPSGVLAVDTTAPTVSIGLQDSALTFGETTEVTFSFSEAVASFDHGDLTIENGGLSDVTSVDGGKTWKVTFTPTVNINDLTNVITVGKGYTDLAGNAGVGGTSPNYSINTLYSPVSIDLGYAPSPLLTSYDATGSFPAVTYLFPEVSKTSTKNSFVQRINLSVPTGGAPSAPTNKITISATNPLTFNGSAYIELKYVWNDSNNNDQFDTGEQQFIANSQSVSFTLPQITVGSPINIKAFSEIDGDGTQLTQKLTFKLEDVDTSTPTDPMQKDLGAATGELNFLLDQTRFSKTANTTAAVIDGFADSVLTVAVNGNSQSQAATTLLGRGSITEGPGAKSPGTVHFLAQDQAIILEAEATITTTTRSPLRRSDPVAVENFQLVWAVPSDASFALYAAASGSGAFNNPDPELNSLVDYINAGYFSESLAQKQIFKDGQTVSGSYKEPGITSQTATAGNLGTANALKTADPPFTGGKFEAYINSLTSPPNTKWTIPIASTVNLNQRVLWSNYSQAANPDVIVISLPTTVAGTKFKIGMGNGGGSLELSKTTVQLTNGDLTGADILGGNAKDFIMGTRGDDLIAGCNGKDTFAFGINSGNDTITDFSGDKLDLTRIGITSADVLSKLDTNGDGAINANVVGGVKDKYVISGSGAPLKLDLSYFSDVAAGLPSAVSNVNGPWNTTTTITLLSVPSLSKSDFAV